MSAIHYFPRYSQKENMVTNNTLLLFSRLYNNSADKFKRFINAVLEDKNIELDTTVKFRQQEKGQGSIPDGVIEQESFKVIIETKLYGQQNLEQIEKHFKSFSNEDKQIFLWINKEPIEEKYCAQIISKLNEINNGKQKKISFASTTFKEICRIFNDNILEYDIEMKELIEDFEAFCSETGLIDNAETKMRVILAGNTYEQNMENSIYYATCERGYQKYKYLGLYKDKAVRGIGEVIGSADILYDFSKDEITVLNVQLGKISEVQKETVKNVVLEAQYKFGNDISKGHRFFFIQKYYETDYIKPTKGGLMGQKYFDLADIDGYNKLMTTEQIAELLKSKEWDY